MSTGADVADPDPRVERSRHAVGQAVLEELATVGYGAMTVESIARRAGVGKATIYRHWSGKPDLVESALDLLKDEMIVPQGETARQQIVELLEWLARYIADSSLSRCMPAIVSAAQWDDAVRDFHYRFTSERRQVLVDLVEAGQASGEFDADLDAELVAETLAGPIFYRRLMTAEPLPVSAVGTIVELVLG